MGPQCISPDLSELHYLTYTNPMHAPHRDKEIVLTVTYGASWIACIIEGLKMDWLSSAEALFELRFYIVLGIRNCSVAPA